MPKSYKSWHLRIRQHARNMILTISVLLLFALADQIWYRSAYENLRIIANDYHLACTFHYLKAMEQLRQDQASKITNMINSNNKKPFKEQSVTPYNRSSSTFLFAQQIQLAITLETKFNDDNFSILVEKLHSKTDLLLSSTTSHEHSEPDNTKTINSLLITLKQLVKLHTIFHKEKINESRKLESNQSTIFLILFSVLLVACILIGRRGFKLINDLTLEQQQNEDKIRHQATYDSLTGLPNRFLSLEYLSKIMENSLRDNTLVAIMFIDIDDFKKINDTLGHETGDKILVETGQRFSDSIRSSDIAGRLGGDEFIMILPSLNNEIDARHIADKILKNMQQTFTIGNRKIMLTASIGIAIYPKNGNDLSDILRNADSAMYHSKKLGRNCYSYFDQSMNTDNLRKLEIEEQMHNALENNELNIHLQPKVDLSTEQIIGAEALLRWNNKKLGSIPPDEFIPIAEQTGLIIPIGKFVISESISTISHLLRLLPNISIAINLSPSQFRDNHLTEFIFNTMEAYQVSEKNIELEITEGVFMKSDPHVEKILAELSNRGISIAMDDFGTGYSSLSYLRSHPFNTLKIDRSFICDMESSKKDQQLIRAAIAMAHSLDLKVVAEGVENEAQLDYLKQLNCDLAQGYYFSKPITINQFDKLLRNQNMSAHIHPISSSLPEQRH